MRLKQLSFSLVLLALAACAEGNDLPTGGGGSSDHANGPGNGAGSSDGGGGSGGGGANTPNGAGGEGGGGCGDQCDADDDGVLDSDDECADTPAGEPVNVVGCSDSQVDPTLQEMWPPYGLTWVPTGDLGRVGGLTWTYTGITRGELFHIYWLACDDPATPCGVSLDGPIDGAEEWQFSAVDSDLPNGRLVFINTTHIQLADATTPTLTGRLTITIVGADALPVPFADVATLGLTALDADYGAEIPAAGFTVVSLIEVQDASAVWTPYLDYYDAASTPDPGPGTAVSFGGSFYDE